MLNCIVNLKQSLDFRIGALLFWRGILSECIDKGVLHMNGKNRSDVFAGLEVDIVLKKDQRTGTTTRGVVKDLLTNSSFHPHGIKVRLTDGQVGRVCQTYPK